MLSILFTVFALLVINFGNGMIINHWLKTKAQSFVMISFLGIIGITLVETIIAFLFPLNSVIEIIFIIFGLIGNGLFFLNKNKIKFDFKPNFWFYFFVVIIIFLASFSPYLFDHFSYYVPTISYLKEIGFVKGISNLDLLLGQTSFWHIYQAGFSHFVDPFLKINSYLLILFLIYIYEKKQYFFLIFIPIFLLFVQQPSPDLPILIITVIVINELINKKIASILLWLSIFAFCIKPIVFWLPLFVVLNNFKQIKNNSKLILSVFVFGFLFLIKNIYLFGFPIFPVSFFDFDLPWKPSEEILTFSSQIGQMNSYDMKYSYQQVLDFDFSEKIYHWFTVGYKSVLNLGIIISISIIGIISFKKKNKFYNLLLICLLLKIIFLLYFSAQYRFFIDVYLIAIFLLFRYLSKSKSIFTAVFFSIIIVIIFSFPDLVQRKIHSGKWMSGFQLSQILKPNESKAETFKSFQIGNLKFKTTNGLSYKTPFPAISLYWLKVYQYYKIFPQVSESGFVQRKLTKKEMIQLEKIITETEKLKP